MSKVDFRGMLKATGIIAGSSIAKIAISMINTKFVAILLGPAGVGLMGTYSTITNLTSHIASLGIGKSGVRQIAESVGTKDEIQIASTVKAVRKTVWITGIIGMIALIVGSRWISQFTFGTTEHSLAIGILGLTVLTANIAMGQSCLLQGMRRISDIAKISIIGSINGLLIGVPCFYLWGMKGIVPNLLVTSFATLATSWYFARRIKLTQVEISHKETKEQTKKILQLGIPLMGAGFVGQCPQFFIKTMLIRELGISAVGIWQAAYNLSGILARFVLGAMITDYYPRLTAISNDHEKVRKEVNAQTEISLLLAVPGLAATIIFAPLAIKIFYSGKFEEATNILRWSVYGVFGQVISWPMGVIILAFGRGKLLFLEELVMAIVYISLMWGCVKLLGLKGTGIAFFLLYMFHILLLMCISFVICRMRWNRYNWMHIFSFSTILASLGMLNNIQNAFIKWPIAVSILFLLTGYCLWQLSVKSDITPAFIVKFFRKMQKRIKL